MTNYKRARELAAGNFICKWDGMPDPKAFKAGADFASRYWLTESEEIKGLVKELGHHKCPDGFSACRICSKIKAFTKLITQLKQLDRSGEHE